MMRALVGVVEGHRKPSDMLLHFAAQLGDQALRGFGEQLREGEGGDALHQRGGHHGQDQRPQQAVVVFADDIVHQVLGGGRQHQAGHAVHRHQHQAEGQQAAARTHQLPDIGEQRAQAFRSRSLGRL